MLTEDNVGALTTGYEDLDDGELTLEDGDLEAV